jgi:hypothetical protein
MDRPTSGNADLLIGLFYADPRITATARIAAIPLAQPSPIGYRLHQKSICERGVDHAWTDPPPGTPIS